MRKEPTIAVVREGPLSQEQEARKEKALTAAADAFLDVLAEMDAHLADDQSATGNTGQATTISRR